MLDPYLSPSQQSALEAMTDRLVEDIYFEFTLIAEREHFVRSFTLDPDEVDRAIALCLSSA